MCLEMVIIGKKSLDKNAGEDVTFKSSSLGPNPAQTMSQGTALFSCGLMESRWPDAALPCSSVQPKPDFGSSLDRLWSRPLEASPGHCTSLSSLLQDLSLSTAPPSLWSSTEHCSTAPPSLWSSTEHCSTAPPSLWSSTEHCSTAPPSLWSSTEHCSTAPPSLWSSTEHCSTAPPSKRQCRSLSCSDDLGRSNWRPQGSRLWTSVEKRRCHSGGSVQRTSTSSNLIFPSIHRSSSVSLTFPGTLCPPLPHYEPSVSPHARTPSPPSSPDSSPGTERRAGDGSDPGLSRSQSHPCEVNVMKVGVKRRRQDEAQRPSLDLAKMTQKLRSFHSLSCSGISSDPNHDFFHLKKSSLLENNTNFTKLHTDKPKLVTKELLGNPPFCPTIEDCGDVTALSTNQKDGEALWAGRCSLYALGGELDIEQIERN